jgi:hypothetical protein
LRSNPGEGVRIVPNFFRWSPLTPTLSPKGRGSRWRGEWRQLGQRRNVQALAPFCFGKIKPVRRQRFVRRAAAVFAERIFARLIIIGDLREPLMRGFFGQRLEEDGSRPLPSLPRLRGRVRVGEWRAEIIEQRFEPAMEQRQPMLHPGMLAPFADRFVERIVGRGGAELRHIAGAKQTNGVAG